MSKSLALSAKHSSRPPSARRALRTRPVTPVASGAGPARFTRAETAIVQPMRRATMTLDVRGRITHCSRPAAALFGRSAEQLIGWPIQAVMPPLPMQELTPDYNIAFVAFWQSGGDSLPLWGIDARGARVALDVTFVHLEGAGQDDGFALILRRKDGSGAAAPELQRYVAVQSERSDAVLVTDLLGSIEYMNPACERLTGRRLADSRGQLLPDFVRAMAAQLPAAAADRQQAPRATAHGTIWSRPGPDGRRLQLESTMRPFVAADGTATHRVYTLRDVGERPADAQRLAGPTACARKTA